MPSIFDKARAAAGERASRKTYKRERVRGKRRGVLRERAGRVGRAALIVAAIVLLAGPVLLVADAASYVPLIMAVLTVLISWLYLQAVDRGVRASVNAASYSCARGESAHLEVQVTNTTPLPVCRVELGFVISGFAGAPDDERTLSCSLAPRETLTVAFDATFPHLGRYEAGVRSVTVCDLLGLFRRRHLDATMNNVVVKPAKMRLGELLADSASSDESTSALKPIPSDNEDYASVREYHRGDPMKTIHWNLSSRNPDGTLYTRLYEEYVNPTLAVVVDSAAPDYDAEQLMSLFDGLVECAAALCEQARLAGIEAEVRFFNASGEQAVCHLAGDDDVSDFVEQLHGIVAVGGEAATSLDAADLLRNAGLRPGSASNVAFVTARNDSSCLSLLGDIAARRKNALVFAAMPRELERRERDRFWQPVAEMASAGVYCYAIESNALGTEVVGL